MPPKLRLSLSLIASSMFVYWKKTLVCLWTLFSLEICLRNDFDRILAQVRQVATRRQESSRQSFEPLSRQVRVQRQVVCALGHQWGPFPRYESNFINNFQMKKMIQKLIIKWWFCKFSVARPSSAGAFAGVGRGPVPGRPVYAGAGRQSGRAVGRSLAGCVDQGRRREARAMRPRGVPKWRRGWPRGGIHHTVLHQSSVLKNNNNKKIGFFS